MPEVKFLVLMLSRRCNLACSYCYAKAGADGPEMSLSTALKAIELMTSKHGRLTVELAGGEPLLSWELVKGIVKHCHPERHRVGIQTNGLLLDEAKLGFLAEHGVGLGLSLDGMPGVNDLQRGHGAKVVAALQRIAAHNLGVNITCVLTRRSVPHLPEFVMFLGSQPAVRVLNLDLVRPLGRAGAELVPTPQQIEAMVPAMLDALAFVNSRRWPPLKIREVDQTRRRSKNKELGPYCLAGESAYAAVTPEGNISACSSLVGDPKYAAGTVDAPQWPGLSSLVCGLPDECRECRARFICRGGCPARRIAQGDSISPAECSLRKNLYKRLAT